MRPKITRENIRRAKEVLESVESLAKIANSHGITRQSLWMTVRRFCQHFMWADERLDENGKHRDLNGLRRMWRRPVA